MIARRSFLAGAGLLLSVPAMQALAGEPAAASVVIDNFAFEPAILIVARGTRVSWTNRDDEPHAVQSSDRTTFKSKLLDTGESFSRVFDRPGRYDYFCSLHPHMTATVIVQG
jgi:plastocyanin